MCTWQRARGRSVTLRAATNSLLSVVVVNDDRSALNVEVQIFFWMLARNDSLCDHRVIVLRLVACAISH